ncbi:MAG: DUF3667 domain-containing protein [Pseudomonadota bacterium]
MQDELEIVGAASVGAVARDVDGDGFLDGPCPNCGAPLRGEYCWNCGQSAKDMQQPVWTLTKDIFDSVLSIDGRLWKTVPALVFRPGHVTRSYLDGKRARYVPPFRLFLIASVAFFLLIFGMVERTGVLDGDDLVQGTDARDAVADIRVDGLALGERDGFDALFDEDGSLNAEEVVDFLTEISEDSDDFTEAQRDEMVEVIQSMDQFTASRQELFNAIQMWAPRMSFMLIPFNIILLTLMHFWVRRIYIYNHVIVALHMQTFLYLAASLAILVSNVSAGLAWAIFGISIPIYFYKIMRKSYDTSRFLTFIRTFFLIVFSFVGLILVVVGVSILGANEAGLIDWNSLSFGEEDNIISFSPSDATD